MSITRASCLIVLSGAADGVSAQSFIQSFTLAHAAFNVQISVPGGKNPEFISTDDQSRRWLNDFRTKPFATPASLQSVDPTRFACLIIPHCPGAVYDLANDRHLGDICKHFIREKKPICAIGMGVAGLFSAMDDNGKAWSFKQYTLTAVSVFELTRTPDFCDLPIIPEDVIKDRGALYSSSEPDAVHVLVDRHLITGQNEQSTLTAVQNVVLLCNQK